MTVIIRNQLMRDEITKTISVLEDLVSDLQVLQYIPYFRHDINKRKNSLINERSVGPEIVKLKEIEDDFLEFLSGSKKMDKTELRIVQNRMKKQLQRSILKVNSGHPRINLEEDFKIPIGVKIPPFYKSMRVYGKMRVEKIQMSVEEVTDMNNLKERVNRRIGKHREDKRFFESWLHTEQAKRMIHSQVKKVDVERMNERINSTRTHGSRKLMERKGMDRRIRSEVSNTFGDNMTFLIERNEELRKKIAFYRQEKGRFEKEMRQINVRNRGRLNTRMEDYEVMGESSVTDLTKYRSKFVLDGLEIEDLEDRVKKLKTERMDCEKSLRIRKKNLQKHKKVLKGFVVAKMTVRMWKSSVVGKKKKKRKRRKKKKNAGNKGNDFGFRPVSRRRRSMGSTSLARGDNNRRRYSTRN